MPLELSKCQRVVAGFGRVFAFGGTAGWLLDGGTWHRTYSLPETARVGLFADGTALVAGLRGLLINWDPASPVAPRYREDRGATGLAGHGADDVWLLWNHELWHFDEDGWSVVPSDSPHPPLHVAPAGPREAWVVTVDELSRIRADGSAEAVPLPSGLGPQSLAASGEVVWVGSRLGGLARLENGRWETRGSISRGPLVSLAPLPDGSVVAASCGKALLIGATGVTTLVEQDVCYVDKVAARGTLVHALGNGCLVTCVGSDCALAPPLPPSRALAPSDGSALFIDDGGGVWAATGDAILRLDGGRWNTEFRGANMRLLWGTAGHMWGAGRAGVVHKRW